MVSGSQDSLGTSSGGIGWLPPRAPESKEEGTRRKRGNARLVWLVSRGVSRTSAAGCHGGVGLSVARGTNRTRGWKHLPDLHRHAARKGNWDTSQIQGLSARE